MHASVQSKSQNYANYYARSHMQTLVYCRSIVYHPHFSGIFVMPDNCMMLDTFHTILMLFDSFTTI